MHLASPWTPRLAGCGTEADSRRTRPAERLVDALAEDIASGTLAAGARLPAHRELAYQLGIGIGTVTKAYGILERRGLVRPVRGRGMFVAGTTPRAEGVINLGINTPPQMLGDRLLAATLTKLAKSLDAGRFGRYATGVGSAFQRAQMARWLRLQRLEIAPEQVLLCNGAQHALSAAFTLALPRGARLLTEAQSYPGALALAHQGGHPLTALACDEQGILPEALERALTEGRGEPAVLYVTPTLQNPTGATMGLARRLAIVALCRRHDITVIEDDVYSIFAPEGMPPLAMLAPERVIYVSGLSKVLTPGLFMGVIAPPAPMVARAADIIRTTSSMASPLTSLMMEEWLSDGTAISVAASIRQEAARRHDLAQALLPAAWRGQHGGPDGAGISKGLHFWLPMPREKAAGLARVLAADGVILHAPERFATDPDAPQSGLRISIGGPPMEALERGIAMVAARLAQSDSGAALPDSGR